MFKYFKRTLSVTLAAAVAAAALAVGAPVEAKAAGAGSGTFPASHFDYIGAVGILSAETSAEIAKTIYDGLAAQQSTISISLSGISDYNQAASAISAIYCEVARNYDVGIVSDITSFGSASIRYSGTEYTFNYTPIYSHKDKYNEMLEKIDGILAGANENWSDYEKALYFHDYIVSAYTFDDDDEAGEYGNANFSAYELLNTGLGVCEAYSSLYSMLLNNVGIRSTKVMSNTLHHTWNLVELDGKWYHVDTTWDDPNINSSYLYRGYVGHENFLNTTEEAVANHQNQSDFTFQSGNSLDDFSDVVDVSVQNAFWKDSTSRIVPIVINDDPSNVQWAALTPGSSYGNFNIALYDLENLNRTDDLYRTELCSDYGNWGWSGCYSVLSVCDNVLFYTTPNKVYGFYNMKKEELYGVSVSDSNMICGLDIVDGMLTYYLSTTPFNSDPTPVTINEADREARDVKNTLGEASVALKYFYGDEHLSSIDGESREMTYKTYMEPTYLPSGAMGYVLDDYYKDTAYSEKFLNGYIITGDTELYGRLYKCRLEGKNATLSDDIKLNLYFDIDTELAEKTTSSIRLNNSNGVFGEYNFSKYPMRDMEKDERGYYMLSLSLAPRQIEESFSIEAYNLSNKGTPGESFTVNSYLNDISSDTDYTAISKSLKAYGAYTNNYFDSDSSTVTEDTAALIGSVEVTDSLREEHKAETNGKENLPDGLSYKSATLILRDTTTMRHYFTIAEGHDISEYTFTIEGETVASSDIKSKIQEDGTTIYYIEKTGIKASELSHRYEISASGGGKTFTLTSSPYTYAISVIDRGSDKYGEAFVSVMKAFLKYGIDASELWKSQNP